MSKLTLPFIEQSSSQKEVVVTIEGCNGVGKSTLLEAYSKEHPNIECSLCVPFIYQTAKEMKNFMLYESGALCSALYYLAGAVEIKRIHNPDKLNILFDRSVWSTFAAAYCKDESIIKDLFLCLQSITKHIFIPNKIIVLEAVYDTCQGRINKKISGAEFDKDEITQFEKKKEFYHILHRSGYDVSFIQTDNLSKNEVLSCFSKIVEPLWKR